MKTNRDIDHLILHGRFHIQPEYGLDMLGTYLEDIMLLEAGARYADLGISQRRAKTMPGVIYAAAGRPVMVQDPALLKDENKTPKNAFAHLRLQGVMRSRDGASSRGVDSLIQDINLANYNKRIDGILIEVNSGGGEAIAGEMLMSALENNPKPVVAYAHLMALAYAHLMASAALEAMLPADEIIASSKAAEVGSIGTMVTVANKFSEWYKQNYTDIYADKSTNKNAAFRAFLDGDMGPLKKELNATNEAFLAAVKRHRPLKGDIEHTLSGAMFQASAARRRGLIDGIGGYNYALKRITAAVKRRKAA